MDDMSKASGEIVRKGRRVRAAAPAPAKEHETQAQAFNDALPWETARERGMYQEYRDLGPARTITTAYERWCKKNGKKPAKQPPSNWYELSGGNYQAFRETDRRIAAIERAETVHGRVVDWDEIEFVATYTLGDKLKGLSDDVAETWIMIETVKCAFTALAIDAKGDPIPGKLTWAERRQAYEAAHPVATE